MLYTTGKIKMQNSVTGMVEGEILLRHPPQSPYFKGGGEQLPCICTGKVQGIKLMASTVDCPSFV